MRSRLVVGSVYGAVTVAMVAGTTAFVGLDKNVSISVDGQVTHVRTYAGTVNTVLHRAGVIVGAHDAITPALNASVHTGTSINILRGRPVTLIIDGVDTHAWVNGDNVDEVLQQVGLRVPDAALSTNRGARVPLAGMEIGIDLPHEVTVQVDNVTHTVVSMKTTVAAVLDEAGITVGPTDLLFPDAQTRPTNGLSIVIVRVTGNEQVET
ncbi:MAG TPA: ubiquitin-like domain-containing protein, partial [Acidothermaceae bacterium]